MQLQSKGNLGSPLRPSTSRGTVTGLVYHLLHQISYRKIGRLYNGAYCASTVKFDAAGEQHRVDAEDNVDAHSWRYWHRYIINGIVGIAVPVSSFRRFRFSFSLGYGPSIHQLHCAAHILSWKWNEHLSFSLPGRVLVLFSSLSSSSPFPSSLFTFLFVLILGLTFTL